MLRLLVLLLLLANAGYWAWSQGLLAAYDLAPTQQAEPQRLTNQIQPEAIQVLTPGQAQKLEVAAKSGAAPAVCLQAGLFSEEQASTLRAALESALPPGSWQFESGGDSARWIVYMGRYSNEEALAKKRGELRQLGVAFRTVSNPALAPGLALASFPTQADAEKELARIATRGVRTARVTQERAEVRGQMLRLAAVDVTLRAQLDELKPPLAGKTLQPCS